MSPLNLSKNESSKNILLQKRGLESSTPLRHSQAVNLF